MGEIGDWEWAERQGMILREDAEVNDLQDFDPFPVAEGLEIEVLTITKFRGISSEAFDQLFVVDSGAFSGATLEFSNGDLKVILNHRHAKTRTRATLTEELTHVQLKHAPSYLSLDGDGSFVRTYDKVQEWQAYSVAICALAPLFQIKRALQLRHDIESFAKFCGVSQALIRYRCQVTGVKLPPPARSKVYHH